MTKTSTPTKHFKVGDTATEIWYSDRVAGRIIAVSANGKKVTWQEDTNTLVQGPKSQTTGGFAAHFDNSQQVWESTPNPNGATREYSLRKNGRYVLKGETLKGRHIMAGSFHFHDYNF